MANKTEAARPASPGSTPFSARMMNIKLNTLYNPIIMLPSFAKVRGVLDGSGFILFSQFPINNTGSHDIGYTLGERLKHRHNRTLSLFPNAPHVISRFSANMG